MSHKVCLVSGALFFFFYIFKFFCKNLTILKILRKWLICVWFLFFLSGGKIHIMKLTISVGYRSVVFQAPSCCHAAGSTGFLVMTFLLVLSVLGFLLAPFLVL